MRSLLDGRVILLVTCENHRSALRMLRIHALAFSLAQHGGMRRLLPDGAAYPDNKLRYGCKLSIDCQIFPMSIT